VTLSAPETVTEGDEITVTATVDTAPETDLTLTLNNGETITIAAGATEGSVTFASRDDDAYQQGDETLELSITETSGGNYEQLDTSATTSTAVVDDSDTTSVTLSAPETVTEGDEITVTATVDHAPETDLTLTLNNGETITIAAGATEGSVTFASHDDDVYEQDGEELTFSIDAVSGGNYEDLDTSAIATSTILDNDVVDAGETASTLEDTALTGNVLDNAETNVGELSVTDFAVENVSYQAGETATIAGKGSLTIDANGAYRFEPHQNYSGPVPQVTYSVTNGSDTVSSTLDLTVTPVADTPDVNVTLAKNGTTTHTVGGSNAHDPEGFSVTTSKDGEAGEISIKDSGSTTGFGVAGPASNGADSEIGNGESLTVALDMPAESVSFQLAWLADWEYAEYVVHYTDGSSETVVVSGNSPEGGHDGIGEEITRQAPAGKMIAAIEFTTPAEGEEHHNSGNDYLVHQVSYVAATSYDVEITTAPTDIDGSESITSVVVSVPDGVMLSAGEQNADGTWTLPL
ncbi:immunoglobulin-like domain-containing protein, partial [Litchfieldella anticariensis]